MAIKVWRQLAMLGWIGGALVSNSPVEGKPASGSPGKPAHAASGPVLRAPRQSWKLALEPQPKQAYPPELGPITAQHAVVLKWADYETKHLSVIRLDTGVRLWKRAFPNLGHRVADGEILFYQRARGAEVRQGADLVALDLASGRELWTAPCDSGPAHRWLLAAEGRVLWQAPGERVVCADGRTGKVLWRLEKSGSPIGLGKETALLQTGPPNDAADYGVYLNSVEAATGRHLRQFLFRATEASGYDLTRTHQFSQPELLVGQESTVGVGFEYYALRAVKPDGSRKWDAPVPLTSPVRVGNLLVANWWRVGGNYDVIGSACLELESGKLVWKQKNPAGKRGGIVGAWRDSALLFETGRYGKKPGRLLAREARTGKLQWSLPSQADQAKTSGPWLVTLRSAPQGNELIGYRLE